MNYEKKAGNWGGGRATDLVVRSAERKAILLERFLWLLSVDP